MQRYDKTAEFPNFCRTYRLLIFYGKEPRTLWEETFYAMGSVSVSYG